MMTATSYKWTPVMTCIRVLFLYSVLMLFHDQKTQGEHTRKSTWEITAESMETRTVLHRDFLGMMGYPFLPSCTLSNQNWNKITGVKSALYSANSWEPFHKLPRLVWHLYCPGVSGSHTRASVQPQERKENRCFLKKSWQEKHCISKYLVRLLEPAEHNF